MTTAIIAAIVTGIALAAFIAVHSARKNGIGRRGMTRGAPPAPAPAPTPQRPVRRPDDGLAPPIQELHPITRVKDGDTFVVDVDGEHRTIRPIGLDTPETVHPDRPVECYGPEASAEAKRLLERGYVALLSDASQGDVDGYGRWLCYVILPDGTDFAEHMIRHGFGKEYRFSRDYARMNRYRHAQSLAMSERAGLWGACQ